MAADPPATLGLVLAGGRARRMGGGDKGLSEVGGRPMLARVIARLAPQCAALILSANGDGERFAAVGLPVIADGVAGLPGPLAGVLAGLDWAAASLPDIAWIVSLPADCPFAPRDLVARLHAARERQGAQLAVAASGGRSHPTIGLWPVALREELRHALTVEQSRRVEGWTARYWLAAAEWPNAPLDPFFNVNTPADLAEAERLAPLDD